jgi:hypothetical protein
VIYPLGISPPSLNTTTKESTIDLSPQELLNSVTSTKRRGRAKSARRNWTTKPPRGIDNSVTEDFAGFVKPRTDKAEPSIRSSYLVKTKRMTVNEKLKLKNPTKYD